MSATLDGAVQNPAQPVPERGRVEDLPGALRTAATSAAREAGGGVALFFVTSAGGAAALRSAAGFPSPAAARAAAEAIQESVAEVVSDGQPRELGSVAALGAAGAGDCWVLPLACGARVHGALVAGGPGRVPETGRAALQSLADSIGLRLDHDRLEAELREIRSRMSEQSRAADQKSEELLKLSEALFAQDIELLRNNEKLGKIEKLKNDFIEKMSRELRTPLNSIIEAIISVLAGENDAITDASKAALRGALDEGTAFLRTLQNILDLWRIKQGELPVEIQDVNLREVIDEAVFSVQDAVGGKNLEIRNHLDERFPKIRTDLAKINQILFLLIENAVKFTPEGRIDIRARIEGDRLECEVRDAGIGICPDDRQFIFDEFYQVDELSSTKYRGAGLGLALVRDLLVLLDGEIGLVSDVGKGSVFTISLPVQLTG